MTQRCPLARAPRGRLVTRWPVLGSGRDGLGVHAVVGRCGFCADWVGRLSGCPLCMLAPSKPGQAHQMRPTVRGYRWTCRRAAGDGLLAWVRDPSRQGQGASGGPGGNRTRVRDASASLRTAIEERPEGSRRCDRAPGRGPCRLVGSGVHSCEHHTGRSSMEVQPPRIAGATLDDNHALRRCCPGWRRWDRTIDRRLIGPVLCQLSYPPVWSRSAGRLAALPIVRS